MYMKLLKIRFCSKELLLTPIAYIYFFLEDYRKQIGKSPLFTFTLIYLVVHTHYFLSPAFLWCHSRAISSRAAGENCTESSQESEAGEKAEWWTVSWQKEQAALGSDSETTWTWALLPSSQFGGNGCHLPLFPGANFPPARSAYSSRGC